MSDANDHYEWDVTALANSDFKVRFSYLNAVDDQWMSVDEVFLVADQEDFALGYGFEVVVVIGPVCFGGGVGGADDAGVSETPAGS